MITQWQFLIQKDGDQDWLPLETTHVEILEGRYTLMAQANAPGIEVEVQIRHEYELDGLLQDVVQRRRQHSDFDGDLELMPLTYLPPGLWELQCRPIADTGEPIGASLHRLKLQVLAQDFELLSDWAMPETFAADSPGKTAAASAPSAAGFPTVSIPVVLPPNLKGIPQAPLRLSDTFRLPPLLYPLESQTVPGGQAPQLPEFLGSSTGASSSACVQTEPMEPHLAFLRCMAHRADRQRVYAAFAPLAHRQRFFKTLHALAASEPVPSAPVPSATEGQAATQTAAPAELDCVP